MYYWKIAPCKDCYKKGCGSYHSQCEKYLEYTAFCEKERQRRFEEKSLDSVIKRRRRNV